jgi:hypothetical protein
MSLTLCSSIVEHLIDEQLFTISSHITEIDPELEPFAYYIGLQMSFYTDVLYVALDLFYSVYFEVQALLLYKDTVYYNVTSSYLPPVAGYILGMLIAAGFST